MNIRRAVAMTVFIGGMAPFAAANVARVEREERITTFIPANNGAGPLWCYGSTVIARHGDDVFASVIETGKDVPLLCNTRWQLWRRDDSKWSVVQQEEKYRQREPCPLAVLKTGELFLSVNPSTQPPGVKYGPCTPGVLRFDAKQPEREPVELQPAWAPDTVFTDHSYRGFAADRARGELLLLNIHARSGDQYVSFRDQGGAWHARGKMTFPIRSCYPQVALRNRAAHVMAIGDIVEPNEEWRKLKYEMLKRDWDYVFRRLFYTWTPDIAGKPFARPIEIDTVEATAGHITNLDVHVDARGRAHLLYRKVPCQYPFIRDKYFPGVSLDPSLEYVIVDKGHVQRRQTLITTPAHDEPGLIPAYARFAVLPDERLWVIAAGSYQEIERKGEEKDDKGVSTTTPFVNAVAPITEGELKLVPLDMEHPFRNFMTATPRAGNAPSETIDLFGHTDEPLTLRYARVRITGTD